jgi:nitroreductase
MKFSELIIKRQSARRYETKTVEKEKLLKCIEAARLAPSACNSQPWHFIIVDDPVLKSKVAAFTTNKVLKMNIFTDRAPVIVVAVTEPSNVTARIGGFLKNKDYNIIDVSIAVAHFCLQAADLGLGTCILGWFQEKKIKKLLGVPRSRSINLVITVGYADPKDRLRTKIRKKIDTIVSYNGYKKD